MSDTSRARPLAVPSVDTSGTTSSGLPTGEELSDREFAEALAAMPASATTARRELRDLGRTIRDLFVHQFPLVLLFSGLGLVIGLLLNSVVRRVFYGSSSQVPSGAPVAGSGNALYGQIATFLMTAIVVGVIAYRVQVGKEQFRRDLRELPQQFGALLRADGRGPAAIHLLWGFAASLAVILVIGTTLGALFAVGAILSFGTVVRPLVASVLMMTFRTVGGLVAPRHRWPPSAAAMVALMGSILAALVAILVQGMLPRIVIAALAAGSAVAIGRRQVAHEARSSRDVRAPAAADAETPAVSD